MTILNSKGRLVGGGREGGELHTKAASRLELIQIIYLMVDLFWKGSVVCREVCLLEEKTLLNTVMVGEWSLAEALSKLSG